MGCNEVANDPELIQETIRLNQMMESVGTPMAIMFSLFPWFPSSGVIRQYYAGTKLYMIFDKAAKARRAEGRKEADAMQVLLDQGDSVKDILGLLAPISTSVDYADEMSRLSLALYLQAS